MGTNPKRTVSVQMVPRMAAVDTLGNKEPNANWAKEPDLQLSQVCPKPTFIAPEHEQGNSPSTNTAAHTDHTASKGGEAVSCTVTDKPAATNGNETKSELVTGRDPQMQDPCPTGPGVGETGGDQMDSNANMNALSTADEKDVLKAAVAPALSAPKVNMQTEDCRINGPNAAEEKIAKPTPSTAAREDSNKNVAPDHANLNNACELKRAIPEPQRDDRGSVLALKDDHAAVPQESQEPGCSRSSVSLQGAAPPGSTTPSCKGKDAKDAFTHASSSSTHPQPSKKPQVSSDRHQPVTSQADSSAPPQATQTTPAGGREAEEAGQADAAALEAQRQRDKLYREASTMTASPSPARAKRRHDMEVQAVASTCSKAVATSPSLLPFVAPRRLSGGGEPREAAHSLVVVHQADGGVELHQVDASSPRPAATDLRSERLTVEAEMCPDHNAGAVFHSGTMSQQQDKRLGAKPKDPGSAVCNTQPVYQINIEHSHHKEPGEMGKGLQSKTGVQKPAAKAAAAEAPPLGLGALPETPGAPKPGSADSHNAAPPQAATKPTQALPTTTTTTIAAAAATNNTSKPGPAKNKSESPKQKAKGGGKAQKKAAKSGKQKTEPEGKKNEDQKETDIHDVVWDEQGMTWEVYGASVDPESLGFAIQSHLQCKIKEQERKVVAQTSLRKSVSGVDPPGPGGTKSKRRRRNIFRSMLQHVRRPNCCARPPPSSVLE